MAGGLDFYVYMTRAARVFSGKDGFEGVLSIVAGVLVATQPKTGVVVVAIAIGLPEVQPGVVDGLACGREDVAADGERRSRETWFT